MASIQRIKTKGGSFSYRAQVSILGVRDSASFPSKAEARQWAAQRELEVRAGVPAGQYLESSEAAAETATRQGRGTQQPPEGSQHTLKDVCQRYAREVSTTKLSERWEVIKLTKFCRHPVALLTLRELGPEHLAAWRDERLKQVSSSTVRREMTLVTHALEIARREWRWIVTNPGRDVRKPPDAKHRTQRISSDDVQALLDTLGYVRGTVPANKQQETAVALLIALETAMRSGEILSLTRQHVHLDHSFVHLPTTKNGSSRNVPLSSAAKELLRLMLELPPRREGRLFSVRPQSRDVLFRRAKVKAGLKHLNFHDSRRTATTRLSEVFSPLELSKVTGHKRLDMLLTYYEKSATELAQKLD